MPSLNIVSQLKTFHRKSGLQNGMDNSAEVKANEQEKMKWGFLILEKSHVKQT